MCWFIFTGRIKSSLKFDTVGHRESSEFLRVNWYFYFIIINAENISYHKYIVQMSEIMFQAISYC